MLDGDNVEAIPSMFELCCARLLQCAYSKDRDRDQLKEESSLMKMRTTSTSSSLASPSWVSVAKSQLKSIANATRLCNLGAVAGKNTC